MSDAQKAVVTPVVAFSFSLNLDGTKENYNSVVAQFHLPVDMDVREMHGYADKVIDVVDRQRDRYRLEDLKRELHVTEMFVKNATDDLARLHAQAEAVHAETVAGLPAGRRKPYKPSPQAGQQIIAAKNNVENAKERVKRIKAEIGAVKGKLGVTHEPANS